MVTTTEELRQRVEEGTGLAKIICKGPVRRALEAVGADPDSASKRDYCRALPELKKRLSMYVGEDAAKERIDKLRSWLGCTD